MTRHHISQKYENRSFVAIGDLLMQQTFTCVCKFFVTVKWLFKSLDLVIFPQFMSAYLWIHCVVSSLKLCLTFTTKLPVTKAAILMMVAGALSPYVDWVSNRNNNVIYVAHFCTGHKLYCLLIEARVWTTCPRSMAKSRTFWSEMYHGSYVSDKYQVLLTNQWD